MSCEIVLLTLPVAIFGAVAWWKSADGEQGLGAWWHQKNQSQIRVVKSFVWTKAPCDMAVEVTSPDTDIVVWVDEKIPLWLRGAQYVPRMWDVHRTAEKLEMAGREGGTQVGSVLSYGRGNGLFGGSPLAMETQDSQFQLQLGVLRAPRKLGELRVNGTFVAKNLPTTPFSIVARPAWMTRAAKKLRVTGVNWQPSSDGKGGIVEVALLYLGGKPSFKLRGEWGDKWTPRFVAPGREDIKGDPNRDEILGHWSQHIESADGQYNSLKELEYAEVELSDSVKVGESYGPSELADHFEPRVLPLRRTVQGKKLRISYQVTSLPKIIKNPVFKAEVGLVGDGFAAVSYPLRSRK